tara:strand:+ start:142 stop:297 length:156 start_codon:yes stop_codon:yes gene_type:complete
MEEEEGQVVIQLFVHFQFLETQVIQSQSVLVVLVVQAEVFQECQVLTELLL